VNNPALEVHLAAILAVVEQRVVARAQPRGHLPTVAGRHGDRAAERFQRPRVLVLEGRQQLGRGERPPEPDELQAVRAAAVVPDRQMHEAGPQGPGAPHVELVLARADGDLLRPRHGGAVRSRGSAGRAGAEDDD
jgi:hypothetical protein